MAAVAKGSLWQDVLDRPLGALGGGVQEPCIVIDSRVFLQDIERQLGSHEWPRFCQHRLSLGADLDTFFLPR